MREEVVVAVAVEQISIDHLQQCILQVVRLHGDVVNVWAEVVVDAVVVVDSQDHLSWSLTTWESVHADLV